MEEQFITVIVTRQELTGPVNYTKTVNLQWSKVEKPRCTVTIPEKLFTTLENAFSVECENYDIETDPVTVEWSVSPSVSSKYISYPDDLKIGMVIAASGLSTKKAYTFSATVTHNDFNLATDTFSATNSTSTPPTKGIVRASPSQGLASTIFTISILGWKSDHKPITYRVFSSVKVGKDWVADQELTEKPMASSEGFDTKMPDGNPAMV
jgi:hypothetical protein